MVKETTERLDHNLRNMVLKRDNKCLLSCVNGNVCDVAHIKSYCSSNYWEKYDTNDCLLLRKDIHTYFDNYMWSIHPITCKIQLCNKLKKMIYHLYELSNHLQLAKIEKLKSYYQFQY